MWLGAKQSNQSSVPSFVQGFVSHNISVGAVNIDSGWSTGYNNFVVDDVKYPDFAGLIRKFKNQGMKVVLWVTSMVNEESSNYNEMIQNRYHLCNAKGEPELVKWWHGKVQTLLTPVIFISYVYHHYCVYSINHSHNKCPSLICFHVLCVFSLRCISIVGFIP